jgi:murein L,D-transpeptidase YcbB/YkuD
MFYLQEKPMSLFKQASTLLIVILSLAGPLELQATESVSAPQISQDIEQLLRTKNLSIRGVDILTQAILLEVYQDHDFAPYWTNPDRIRELMDLIQNSADHGLIPADYNNDQLHQVLQRRMARPSAEIEAEADILLTESLLRYGYHRRFGKVKASTLDPDINFRRENFHQQAPTVTIEQALESSSLTDFIQMAAPSGPVYQHLQIRLELYRDMADTGGWPTVADGPTLRVGDNDARVASIRKRLAATGRVADHGDLDSTLFDQPLKNAVKGFQLRHRLGQDGIVGQQTIAALNVPVEHRINQIRTSLERLRWVNQEAVDTMVVVNIAGFRAFFFKDGALEWDTRAMVGKNYRQTPVFRGDISYLEFNPTWTIPPGILRNDTLPAIKRDPNYLASKNIRVIDHKGNFVDPATVNWNKYKTSVPYTLRQDPGPKNSLGTVKFIFPNKHFVFLHDTPHRELFSQKERNFSSGCIRIQDPLKLAELVLNNPVKYNRSELESIVDSRKTQRIHPSPKVPVVIVYLTASVNDDGKVRFYKDIYDRDQKVLDALNGPVVIQAPGA